MQVLSPARVEPLYGAGRKESSGTGLASLLKVFVTSLLVVKSSLLLFTYVIF